MPIDLASGKVELDREDFSLSGRVPITWTRSFRSRLLDESAGPLGLGWTNSWFPTLSRDGTDWRFIARDGSINVFPDPANDVNSGRTVRLLGSFMEIALRRGDVRVTEWNVDTGEIEVFVFRFEPTLNAYQLSAIESVSGDAVELRYTPTGQLSNLHQQIEDRTINVIYTQDGHMSALSLDGGPALVSYEYDSVGRLFTAVNRRGFAHRYEYDAQSRLKREMLPDGAVYTYKYDDQGRCIHFTGLEHYNEKRLRFLDPIGTTILTNSYGVVKTFKSNASGQIESEATPTGAERQTKYDEHGRIVERVDELGASTAYTYDESGNRNSITDALGNVTQFTFNAHHQPTSMIDATGHIWKREYNSEQRLSATENPLGARWRIEYDQAGNPTEIIEPQGFKRRQKFERGMLRESTDFMDHKSTFAWDGLGQLIERTGPVGEQVRFQYDPGGNLIQVEQPDGSVLRASYDSGDNLSSYTNAKGHSIQYRYGSCRRLLERTDAIGRSVRYEWGTEPDRLDTVINEKGERFSYIRDDEGRVVLERSFDGREHHFEYDAAGRVTGFTNGNGERIKFQRDPLGRLVEQVLPTGEITSFEFDPLGRILAAINPDVEVKFEFDPAGRLIRESQNQHWVETEYNLADHVVRTATSLDHEVKYELDPNGRVNKLTTTNDQSLSFERDARGLEIGRQMPGDMRMEQRYDSMGRLVEQRVGKSYYQSSASPHVLASSQITPSVEDITRNYTYNQDGLLLSIQDAHWGTADYTYDPADRLLSTFREKGVSESFEFDATDNLRRSQWQNGTTTDEALTCVDGNRIVQRGDTLYEYDPNGRMIRKTENVGDEKPQVWEYVWDARDRLKELRRPDGDEWKYHYDAFSRRVAKVGPKIECKYVWNGEDIIHEGVGSNSTVTWIMKRASFAPLACIRAGKLLPIITDHIGTPFGMFGSNGELIWYTTVSAWGEMSIDETSSHDVSIRFQGQWFDEESHLHYNRFRYYDPKTARYISADPIGIAGGLNEYSYPPSPANWVDPLGLTGQQGCADAADADAPQYFIEDGVRRSVAARERGASTVPAIIHEPGQPPVRADIPLSQLNSPKPVVPRDQRMVNTLMQPGPPPPISVTPMPGPVPSVPLADVKLVRARP